MLPKFVKLVLSLFNENLVFIQLVSEFLKNEHFTVPPLQISSMFRWIAVSIALCVDAAMKNEH